MKIRREEVHLIVRVALKLTIALLIVSTTPASADLGLLSWGALTPQNRTASGRTLYGGDVRHPFPLFRAPWRLQQQCL